MTDYHQLSTEKYVQEAQAKEVKQIRTAMAKQSERSLMLFCFALVTFLLAMLAVFQMPTWMPAISDWLQEIGVLSGHVA
jgi:hypothetical protein